MILCQNCNFWDNQNKRCIDAQQFYNIHGESVCRYNPDAIPDNSNLKSEIMYILETSTVWYEKEGLDVIEKPLFNDIADKIILIINKP